MLDIAISIVLQGKKACSAAKLCVRLCVRAAMQLLAPLVGWQRHRTAFVDTVLHSVSLQNNTALFKVIGSAASQ